MRAAVVLGTRPEIIKLCSLIRELERTGNYFIVHTNQHYSANMDEIFFKELKLPAAHYNLGVGSASHGRQTAQMLEKIEGVFLAEKPDIVFVQGDTNSVLAGALAAAKLGIKVGHVEAGLRSFDRTMPEELNRIMVDHIADYLFCPTEDSADLAKKEGIDPGRIFVTGNTVVDAVNQNVKLAKKKPKKPFVLLTMHRPGNVDDPERLRVLLDALRRIGEDHKLEIVFPIHPRTQKNIDSFGLSLAEFSVIEPQGYLDFLALQQAAELIITDSGGIQEEACILGVPCLTIRPNTERPETVAVGANALAGETVSDIVSNFSKMRSASRQWKNPYGDGKAAERILALVQG